MIFFRKHYVDSNMIATHNKTSILSILNGLVYKIMNVHWLLGALREKISTKLLSVVWKIFKLPLTYQPPKQQVDLKFGQFRLEGLVLIALYTKL